MPDRDEILAALRQVEDPGIRKNIVDLDMVRDIQLDGDRVTVRVALAVPGGPSRDVIENAARTALLGVPGVGEARVELIHMNDEERSRLAQQLQQNSGQSSLLGEN